MPTSAYAGDVKNTTGLTAYWRLNDLVGLTAVDSWTNNIPGTLSGGVTKGQPGALAGDPATSFTFDGSTGSVYTTATILTATANVTMECWFNISSESVSGCFIKCGSLTTGYGLGIGNGTMETAGNHLIALYESLRWIDTGVAVTTLGWHHAALVLDGSGHPRVYLDGSLVYSDSIGGPNAPSGGTFVGDDGNSPGLRVLVGGLQEVAFYTAALTGGTISTHYNDGVTTTVITPNNGINSPHAAMSAVDILTGILNQQDNSSDPINPSEITASYESADEGMGMTDALSFKNVAHSAVYNWSATDTIWGEFQWG